MTSQLAIQKEEPKPSDTLLNMVEEIKTTYGNLGKIVKATYEQAISEGFTPEGAKKWVLKNSGIPPASVYRALPGEAKNPNMGRPTLSIDKVKADKETKPVETETRTDIDIKPEAVTPEPEQKEVNEQEVSSPVEDQQTEEQTEEPTAKCLNCNGIEIKRVKVAEASNIILDSRKKGVLIGNFYWEEILPDNEETKPKQVKPKPKKASKGRKIEDLNEHNMPAFREKQEAVRRMLEIGKVK